MNFLDDQLEVLERTEFLKLIPEFKCIFVNLVIMMAYDFGLPSLNIGEESSAFNITDNNQVIKIFLFIILNFQSSYRSHYVKVILRTVV